MRNLVDFLDEFFTFWGGSTLTTGVLMVVAIVCIVVLYV